MVKNKGGGLMRSMTGYGRGEMRNDGYHFTAEIRSINHRHLEPVIRLPRNLMAQEDPIRKKVQERVYRGRVEIFINQETSGHKRKQVVVDEEMAAAYYRALEHLQENFFSGQSGLTAERLAAFPDVLIMEKDEPEQEQITPLVLGALGDALDELLQQREAEGNRLAADISRRLQELGGICAALQEKSPLVPERYREKLAARLDELHDGREYDKQRFFTEVALFAERANIDEEIVRLESHLEAFRGAMQGEEAIGRKLDFLLQEMNREVNTIAAKGNDMELSRLTIAAKSEIEKIREQVQNIE